MPRLDGFAATRLIRAAEADAPGADHRDDGVGDEGERERCLEAGMDDFLSKPVGCRCARTVLREQLAGDRPRGGAPGACRTGHRAPARSRPGTRAGPVRTATVAATLDAGRLEELAEMGAASFPLIQRAIDHFVDDAGDNVGALRDELRAGDAALLRSTAHRLKGSAANLGALRVAELALELELLAESGRLCDAGRVVDELDVALVDACAALRDYRLEAGSVDESAPPDRAGRSAPAPASSRPSRPARSRRSRPRAARRGTAPGRRPPGARRRRG